MSTSAELREAALAKFGCRCGNEDLCDSEPVHIKKFWQAAYSQGYKDALKAAATAMDNLGDNWVRSAILALPIPEAKK